MTGAARVSVSEFLRTGRAVRPPLVTTLFYRSAEIGGDMSELLADPARLTRALLEMRRLFDTDVVAVKLGNALLEASGSAFDPDDPEAMPILDAGSVPAPEAAVTAAGTLLDVIGRLSAELKRTLPVLAVLPGPAVLSAGLDDADAARAAALVRALVEGACKAGASLVLLDEGAAAGSPRVAQLGKSAVNIARYYRAQTIVAGDPTVPKSLADGLLLPALRSSFPAAGQRLGLRLDSRRFAHLPLAGLDADITSTFFLSVDDVALTGHSVEAIVERFDLLHAPFPHAA